MQSRRVEKMGGKWYLILAVIVLTGIFVAVFSFSKYTPTYAATLTRVLPSCEQINGYTVLIADNHGYNNSISHGAPSHPWPVISARQGGRVNLTFCNLDSVEAHGLAIDNYFDRGVILAPGEAYQISFIATTLGSFRIFCTNFCTVHRYMSGTLSVT